MRQCTMSDMQVELKQLEKRLNDEYFFCTCTCKGGRYNCLTYWIDSDRLGNRVMNRNLGDIGPESNAHVLNYLHNDMLGGREVRIGRGWSDQTRP